MKLFFLALTLVFLMIAAEGAYPAPPRSFPISWITWSTVVNNSNEIPTATCHPADPSAVSTDCRTFNSYNQPSVNTNNLVVFRARSQGGGSLGEPIHGVYTRNMISQGPIIRVMDRSTAVPQPNNRDAAFTEPPSFPRIDMNTNTIVTRGNHPPVWQVTNALGEVTEQAGTSGIYANPFGPLITAASKLGGIADFSFFAVPGLTGTYFDVFPGAPAVTDGDIIVFKGNYTETSENSGSVPEARTGVYYRVLTDNPIALPNGTTLSPAAGNNPVVTIADTRSTPIPGSDTNFGSTAPPSAADGMAVFAGFDNEDDPHLGGIYLAALNGPMPKLTTLISIGGQVPGEDSSATFSRLGEGISFDGRFVAFWGAWGSAHTTLVLQCPTEGNKDTIAYCNQLYPNGDPVDVPLHQGIFVYDIHTGKTRAIAKSPADFDDFLFWNFSGHVPGVGETDSEPPRWRASAFVAVSGTADNAVNARFSVAFKARSGQIENGAYVAPIDGIYLREGPGQTGITALVQTGMEGTIIDPQAVYTDPDSRMQTVLPVTDMGIERDGFRGNSIVVDVSMGTEEAGWAGIYLGEVH